MYKFGIDIFLTYSMPIGKVTPGMSLPHGKNVLCLDSVVTWENVVISDEFTELQKKQVRNLLSQFLTNVTTHLSTVRKEAC